MPLKFAQELAQLCAQQAEAPAVPALHKLIIPEFIPGQSLAEHPAS